MKNKIYEDAAHQKECEDYDKKVREKNKKVKDLLLKIGKIRGFEDSGDRTPKGKIIYISPLKTLFVATGFGFLTLTQYEKTTNGKFDYKK